MNRVDLDISKLKKFQDIALLVDRDDFLKELTIVRTELKNSGKIKHYSNPLLLFFSFRRQFRNSLVVAF